MRGLGKSGGKGEEVGSPGFPWAVGPSLVACHQGRTGGWILGGSSVGCIPSYKWDK